MGLTWARHAQFRVAYHVNPHFAVGVALENPEQFGGQGEVTFPAFFNAQLNTQIDEANTSTTPNRFPDIVVKAAYDSKLPNGLPFHLEAVGLVSQFHVVVGPNGRMRRTTSSSAPQRPDTGSR